MNLNEETIKDILTTAIEGGIGYWACLGNDDPIWVKTRDNYIESHNGERPYYCDVAYDVMNSGNAVIFYDEEDDDTRFELTMSKFMDGCKLYEDKTGTKINDSFDDGSFDACDADMIIQYALFGEVIYG